MDKLKKLLKTIGLILKQPSLVNKILDADEVWNKTLLKKYPKQETLPVVSLNELIPNFNETLNTFAFLGGGSLPTDIMLLKALAKQIDNCSYFEIGTWRGESVINVADTAKECYTLNLSKEEMIHFKMPKKYTELHGFFSKGRDNITHLFGNSLNYNYSGLNKKFDLIFIDGNHTFPYVKNDTQKVFTHLVHKNSIVVWHDYAYHPEKIRPEVLKGILDGTPQKYHANLYHVANTMCAIYIPKKLKNTVFEAINTPSVFFEVTAKLRRVM